MSSLFFNIIDDETDCLAMDYEYDLIKEVATTNSDEVNFVINFKWTGDCLFHDEDTCMAGDFVAV